MFLWIIRVSLMESKAKPRYFGFEDVLSGGIAVTRPCRVKGKITKRSLYLNSLCIPTNDSEQSSRFYDISGICNETVKCRSVCLINTKCSRFFNQGFSLFYLTLNSLPRLELLIQLERLNPLVDHHVTDATRSARPNAHASFTPPSSQTPSPSWTLAR